MPKSEHLITDADLCLLAEVSSVTPGLRRVFEQGMLVGQTQRDEFEGRFLVLNGGDTLVMLRDFVALEADGINSSIVYMRNLEKPLHLTISAPNFMKQLRGG